MHGQLSGASASCVSNNVEDREMEALVLDQIIFLYPEALTFEELVREMSKGAATNFARRDQVQRAVCDLSGAGLVQRVGALVLPTRAACYFAGIDLVS